MMALLIDQIRTDGGTQSRAAINEATVAEYADAMADPDTVFPPVIVYFDGREYWLADGFHRVAAWASLGRTEIPVEIRQGDRRRAILHSVAANSAHGLRRTNEDKRRAVMTLLEDAEWSTWTDSEVARRCAVSHTFVAKMREALTCNVSSEATEQPRTYTTKHGTTATMNTANIGSGSKDDQKTESAQPPVAQAENDHRPSEGNRQSQTDQEDTPAPEPMDPAEDKLRRELAKLTTAALIDDLVGLRAQLSDERAKRRKVEAERDDLRAKLRDLTDDDSGEVIRRLHASVKHSENMKWRETENTAAALRQVHALKKEVDRLRKELGMQEIPLGGAA